jgi:hypothetical protein
MGTLSTSALSLSDRTITPSLAVGRGFTVSDNAAMVTADEQPTQDGTIYYSTEAVYRPDLSTYSEVLVQPSALRKLSPDGSVRTLLTLNDPSPMGGTYVPSFVNFVATDASGNLYALSYNQQIQVGSYSFLYPFTV